MEAREQAFLEEILAKAVAASSGEVEGFMTMERKVPVFIPEASSSWDWGNLTAGRFSKMVLPFDDGSLAP